MSRKANVPYHAKLGGVFGGKIMKPKAADVDAFGKKLEFLHNKHEWATDGFTEIKALDFGNIGEKFETVLEYDINMLLYTFQVPSVLMGTANVNEGIAQVQMDAFERRVQSIQMELEKVIEEQIFRRILEANGFGPDIHVEFEWGRPSKTETYKRLTAMTEIMRIPTTSMALTGLMEKEVVKLLSLPEDEYEEKIMKEEEEREKREEEERKREQERPQPIVPGQNAKPPKPVPKVKPKQPTPAKAKANAKLTEAFFQPI